MISRQNWSTRNDFSLDRINAILDWVNAELTSEYTELARNDFRIYPELMRKLFLSTLIVDEVMSELRWRGKSRVLKKNKEQDWK